MKYVVLVALALASSSAWAQQAAQKTTARQVLLNTVTALIDANAQLQEQLSNDNEKIADLQKQIEALKSTPSTPKP